MKKSHENADKILYRTEKQLARYYNEQFKKIQDKMIKFLIQHEKEINKKLDELKNKEISKNDYRNYIFGLFSTKQGHKLLDKIADEIAVVNINALKISKKKMKDIYIENYNSTVKSIGESLLED